MPRVARWRRVPGGARQGADVGVAGAIGRRPGAVPKTASLALLAGILALLRDSRARPGAPTRHGGAGHTTLCRPVRRGGAHERAGALLGQQLGGHDLARPPSSDLVTAPGAFGPASASVGTSSSSLTYSRTSCRTPSPIGVCRSPRSWGRVSGKSPPSWASRSPGSWGHPQGGVTENSPGSWDLLPVGKGKSDVGGSGHADLAAAGHEARGRGRSTS